MNDQTFNLILLILTVTATIWLYLLRAKNKLFIREMNADRDPVKGKSNCQYSELDFNRIYFLWNSISIFL